MIQPSRGRNTSYLTDSCIVFTIKLESGSKITIFGLKMVVKTGLEKFILKSLHAGRWLFLLLKLRFCAKLNVKWIRRKWLPHGEISKKKFYTPFHYHFQTKNYHFRYIFHFEGKNDAWISHVRRVKCIISKIYRFVCTSYLCT